MSEQKKHPVKKPMKNRLKPKDASTIVGYYSVDGDRTFIPDSSQLLYFNPPKETKVHLDLNEGIESAILLDARIHEEGIDLLLEWLKLNYQKLKAEPATGRFLQPQFICTRGILTTLMLTPNPWEPAWTIYAAKWQGNIYLCADKSNRKFADTARRDKFNFWGMKFEQHVLSAIPEQFPDTSKPVVEAAEFRCVYQRRIGNHRVLFSALMKGVCSETALQDPLPLEKLKFIETKLNTILENSRQKRAFQKYRCSRWWAQCYLTDTQEVLCGFRDHSGIVQKLQRYNIKEIVAMSEPYWNPKTCIDFCQSFLTKISETVVDECNETLYRFEKIPNEGINVSNFSSENQCGFIPESFMEALG